MKETPDQIARRLMAPNNPSGLWTYDEVRRLIVEAGQSAPLSAGERQEAWAALRMVSDAMGELFGPLVSTAEDDHRPSRRYHQEAERIIAGLQRIADRLALSEAAAIVGGAVAAKGENWTGEAHELRKEVDARVKAISRPAPKP